MDRRDFFRTGAVAAAGAALAPLAASAAPAAAPHDELKRFPIYPLQERFRIGYTTNTRGGWEGDPWKGIMEGREVGFRYFEIFGNYFGPLQPNARTRPDSPPHIVYYPDEWEALQHRMWAIGAQFIAVTGGEGGKSTDFADPSKRKEVIDSHFNMTRFSRRFGCEHQKTNLGPRRPTGTTDADLKEMAITCNELGKRIKGELGIRFGIHPHLGNQLQNEHETMYMMENTDPEFVGLILDTGHITMAGMDPLALAKKLGHRVHEFHFKDTKPEDRGGTKNVPKMGHDQMADPYFFPLGNGGVDFPGIVAYLESIDWRGCLNVELDASPWRAPKDSAKITADYIVNTLKIPL
ncbi:TIM barrel protein [Sphingomonas sp. AOB5]|uniref:sugar phosphate isomerase/epimerase family protein n=1 Tax=Sphingomonas sp. AOB5 TaxID=3034017 RepID=UPI0023FA2732|nr:TIM barrel protein [Sphingomonas sp. AOB5]MDF7776304.1 TIM barrel protein [Sphingomonas sp. AOB5]